MTHVQGMQNQEFQKGGTTWDFLGLVKGGTTWDFLGQNQRWDILGLPRIISRVGQPGIF